VLQRVRRGHTYSSTADAAGNEPLLFRNPNDVVVVVVIGKRQMLALIVQTQFFG
jgi:hypothetical protein